MKKLITLLATVLLFTSLIQAQALKDSWSLGFGGSLLNHTSTNLQIQSLNSFGGYFSIQRNFRESTPIFG